MPPLLARALLAAVAFGNDAPVAPDAPRLILLGFDGADARLTKQYLEEGKLPNLAKLQAQGSFYALRTTNPAQSPVSWASINTGLGPDETNIYDFVCRLNEDRTRPGVKLETPAPALFAYPTPRPADPYLPPPLRESWRTYTVAAAGVVLLLVFFAVFRFGAKFPSPLSLALSVGLAGLGSGAGFFAFRFLPKRVPVPQSEVRGTPFWKRLSEKGIRTVGLSVPITFPFPEHDLPHTKMLSGLGVPDARQSTGDWFFLTSDAAKAKRLKEEGDMGGIPIVLERDPQQDRGRAKAYAARIEGPENFWLIERIQAENAEIQEALRTSDNVDSVRELTMRQDELARRRREEGRPKLLFEIRVAEDQKSAAVELQHKAITHADGRDLAAGEWSPLTRSSFQLNPLLRLSVVVRFRILSLDPLEIFLKPINLDPKAPPPQASLSTPRSFSAELASAKGFTEFETLGWACATNALKDEAIDDETFLGDIENVLAQRERLLVDRLEKNDWQVFYEVFGETDRVQHMMFRYIDPEHPLYSKERAEREVTFFGKRMPVKECIPEIYRQMDRLVGETMRRAVDARTTLIVLSDHGFSSFRRQVHLNNWLLANGYMALKPGSYEGQTVTLEDLKDPSRVFGYIDWKATRAYSLGLGKIYLNVKGRETCGIVDPEQKEALEREIAAKLEASIDPLTEKPFVRKAYLAREIYPKHGVGLGPGERDNAEDITLGFHEGYRVSWGSALGGLDLEPGTERKPRFHLAPNQQKWSGDHCSVDPSLVSGILFSSQRLTLPADAPGPEVRHIAPTVLRLFRVEVPPGLREPLLDAR